METEKTMYTKNGVEIHSYRNGKINSFSVSLFIKCGPAYESEKNSGFAHFFEHMVFRNINAHMQNRLYETLDRFGLYFNAVTYVNYMEFTVTGAPVHFAKAAEIICLVFSPFIISKKEIDLEAKRIKAEIREENADSLSEFSDSIVYSGSPLERPITGKCSDVNRYGINMLKKERKNILTKENIFFFAGGNFPCAGLDYLCSTIEKYEIFSAVTPGKSVKPPLLFGRRNCVCKVKNSPSTSVRVSFDVDLKNFSVPEAIYLSDLLFSGESCPVYRELSENSGLIYSYEDSMALHGEFAVLSVWFDVRADRLIRALSVLFDIFSEAKYSLGERIQYVKPIYTDNIRMSIDDSESIVSDFGYYNHILNLGYFSLKERRKAFGSVSPERMNLYAKQTFTSDNLVIAVKGNKKNIKTEVLRKLAREKLG